MKADAQRVSLSEEQTGLLTGAFTSQLPKLDKKEFHVEVGSLGEAELPVVVTQSEYMRRMKEMSRLQSGMAFYGEMPDMYTLVLNADHPLVRKVLETTEADTREALAPSTPKSKAQGPRAGDGAAAEGQKGR